MHPRESKRLFCKQRAFRRGWGSAVPPRLLTSHRLSPPSHLLATSHGRLRTAKGAWSEGKYEAEVPWYHHGFSAVSSTASASRPR